MCKETHLVLITPSWFALYMKPRIIIFALLLLPSFSMAQDVIGAVDLTGTGDVNIDRFGKPVFGLRAAREPELRRLRAQAGRPVLNARVEVFDVTPQEIEGALNGGSLSRKMPKIACDEIDGKVVCAPR